MGAPLAVVSAARTRDPAERSVGLASQAEDRRRLSVCAKVDGLLVNLAVAASLCRVDERIGRVARHKAVSVELDRLGAGRD